LNKHVRKQGSIVGWIVVQ